MLSQWTFLCLIWSEIYFLAKGLTGDVNVHASLTCSVVPRATIHLWPTKGSSSLFSETRFLFLYSRVGNKEFQIPITYPSIHHGWGFPSPVRSCSLSKAYVKSNRNFLWNSASLGDDANQKKITLLPFSMRDTFRALFQLSPTETFSELDEGKVFYRRFDCRSVFGREIWIKMLAEDSKQFPESSEVYRRLCDYEMCLRGVISVFQALKCVN